MRAPAAKKYQRSDESLMPYLPNHVLPEILSRLPIKTLMAVKCVCKSWLNLVSGDTHFAALHHRRSKPEILLRSSITEHLSAKHYLGALRFHNNTLSGSKLSLSYYPLEFNVRGKDSKDWNNVVFVNSCNGFVCFSTITNSSTDSSHTVICNPVTGEFITTSVPSRAKLGDMKQYSSHGLGFSVKENRYKLLQITRRWEENPVKLKLFAEICTLEEGSSWRNLGSLPHRIYLIILSFPYVFLEGKLHFQCPLDAEGYIDCFDFDNEQFGKVPLPPPSNSRYKTQCIRELGGCLSVTRYGSGYRIEIWVMKEYGVRDSWIRAVSFEDHRLPDLPRPLLLGNGETLVYQFCKTLALYNFVLDNMKTLGSSQDSLEVISYTPTLVRLEDALAGYQACLQNASSRSVDPGVLNGWQPSEC